jgi:hypothetical protein
MTLNEITDRIEDLEESILSECDLYPAQKLGLDSRCGLLYVAEDFIATKDRRSLDYYGGFEYIDPECITSIGSLTIYSIEHDRVLEAITYLEHTHD